MAWTEDEVTKLKELLNEKTLKEISEILGKNAEVIRWKCRSLGLIRKNPRDKYSSHRKRIYATFREIGLAGTMRKYGLTKDQVSGIVYREREREKKILSGIKITRAERLRLKALRVAHDEGIGFHAEDFASFCVVRLYEGSSFDIRKMAIDYKKATFGDWTTEVGKTEVLAHWSYIEIGESDEDTFRIDPEDDHYKRPRLNEILKRVEWANLDVSQRAVLLLHTLFGLNLKEIGIVLNFTESRASQILTSATDKLDKKMEYEG